MSNIYDGAFRTIVNDCRKLLIPVINEVFGEMYSGEEHVEFFPNEHFIEQQDIENQKRITDTSFVILGRVRKIYHLESESSLPDGRMTIRLFEYDAQIALDGSEVTEEILARLDDLEQQGIIGAFDKGTIIKLSEEVIREIARNYENV